MVNSAHFITAGARRIVVRDDRGTAVTEVDLPASVTSPAHADEELHAAGWRRSGDTAWTEADDGWVVPVEPT
jgi:hypothetical protein